MVNLIKTLASQHGTTLKALEKEIGLGNGTIAKWDHSQPRVDKLQKVAEYFDVSIDYLVGRTDKPKINK